MQVIWLPSGLHSSSHPLLPICHIPGWGWLPPSGATSARAAPSLGSMWKPWSQHLAHPWDSSSLYIRNLPWDTQTTPTSKQEIDLITQDHTGHLTQNGHIRDVMNTRPAQEITHLKSPSVVVSYEECNLWNETAHGRRYRVRSLGYEIVQVKEKIETKEKKKRNVQRYSK